MLTYVALIGWMYMFLFIIKYLVARHVFKMSAADLYDAMEENGMFFVIKSGLEK